MKGEIIACKKPSFYLPAAMKTPRCYFHNDENHTSKNTAKMNLHKISHLGTEFMVYQRSSF